MVKKYQEENISAAACGTVERPLVAIVGRQNVGKSTLLNRLAGKRIAIVEDFPGTTRDRLTTTVTYLDKQFTLIDTGGIESNAQAAFSQEINRQVDIAMNEANVVLFVVSAKDSILASDIEIGTKLRPIKAKVILVINKADTEREEAGKAEFRKLGLGDAVVISAYHGRGINELLDAIVERFPQESTATNVDVNCLKIAIVGRPNVGKSKLLNCLLGEDRVIVSPIPGTTRDAIDTTLVFEGQDVVLIDTAGIKRRGRQGEGADKYSVLRSMDAIDRSDVALLVLDASELVTAQDLHVAGYVQKAFKGIIIIVNKWDLNELTNQNEVIRHVRANFKFLQYAPILFTSALNGSGITDVLPQATKVYKERHKRIETSELNNTIQQVLAKHAPPHKGGKQLKFLYATQAEVNPPVFVFFVNDATLMHFSYQRYLENQLRQNFEFFGTPIKLVFKARGKK